MMVQKVLFTASVVSHLKAFHVPYMQYFREKGYAVHTAARGENTIAAIDTHHNIAFERSPFSLKSIGCYKALKKRIEENSYGIIHCHTPVVGVLTRLAARRARKKGTVVIYTAHGFHFFDGAPFLTGRIFRLLEKWLSRYTDHLITINEEDYLAVRKYGFKPGAFYKVHGVGVDTARFAVQTEDRKRESRNRYGIGQRAFVLVFAAEYSKRKNQEMLLEAMRLLKEQVPQALLLLPGDGPLYKEYERMIQAMGITGNVRLMGYRNDMDALLLTADVAVASSVQEGLPINVVEAMAVSLPVVATRIRGHVDLVADSVNGFLVDLDDAKAMAEKLLFLYQNPDIARNMGRTGRKTVEPYLLHNAKTETTRIYDTIIDKAGH
ncbi:MAG: glycosyltransferase family 4 protein [Bacillota bacterium]